GREVSRDEVGVIVEESRAAFASGSAGFWLVERAGAFVGFVGFRAVPGSTELELYYGLDPASWGQGLATEASRAALRHAFDVLGLERVWIRTDGPNAASAEVMKRLGASYVRTEATGEFGTTIVYVIGRQ